MEKDSLGETYFSFPKIDNKEQSTYYKSFYSRNPLKNQKNETNQKFIVNSPKTNKGRNRAFSSLRKYTSQLMNNIINKNKKNKMTLLKNKYSFSSAETDDTFFALSEVRRMDKLISKRINKGFIWKEKLNNIYDICTYQNKKDIQKVREAVKLSLSDDNFDLKSEIDRKKYFPVEEVEVINEAKKIMNNMKKDMEIKKRARELFRKKNRVNLHDYVKQNRAICKSNFVIGVIKSERNRIKIKEKEIKKALEDANNIFIKDFDDFDKFAEKQKQQFRETDFRLDDTIRKNKKLFERVKKCQLEVHNTETEIKKIIKEIISQINYADFIHKLLGKEKINIDIKTIKNNLHNKEKDLTQIINLVINQFDFLFKSNEELPFKADEINNPDLLASLFFSLESNIIKQMDIRDEVIKEKQKQKLELDSQILSLEKKLESEKKILNILYKELGTEKLRYNTNNYKSVMDDASEFIYEIYNELHLHKLNQEKIQKKPDVVIKNTFDIIHKMEDQLIKILHEIEIIQGDDKNPELFKKAIERAKFRIKNKKQEEGKRASLKLKEERGLKYLQRMNRFKKRGPIIYPPPWALNKKKGNSEKKKKKIDNIEDLMYYN